jgi:hypothetical protein
MIAMRLLRMLGIALGMLAAAGFGLCGVWGVAMAALHRFDTALFLICGLVGILLGVAIGLSMWQEMKRKRSADEPPAQ